MEPETKPKVDRKQFNTARSNLAFSQRIRDEIMASRRMEEQGQMPMEEEMEMPMEGEEMAPEAALMEEAPIEEVAPNPEEEVKKEAGSIQDISQKVAEATEVLKQGIEGLTAAVKEIAPAKSKLREKLKGMITDES